MQNNLISIDEIITRARKLGATLGHGSPKVHLAYLTKLHLLPPAIRRKTRLPDGQVSSKITGCYPEYVILLVKRIEEMKTAGLTYSQIRFQLKNQDEMPGARDKRLDWKQEIGGKSLIPNFYSPDPNLVPRLLFPASSPNALAFLITGLILGFLLATSRNLNQTPPTPITILPGESNSPITQAIRSNNSSSDPIYVIAIPNQNLYKLGKTDINLLR